MDMYSKCNDVDSAFQVFKELPDQRKKVFKEMQRMVPMQHGGAIMITERGLQMVIDPWKVVTEITEKGVQLKVALQKREMTKLYRKRSTEYDMHAERRVESVHKG